MKASSGSIKRHTRHTSEPIIARREAVAVHHWNLADPGLHPSKASNVNHGSCESGPGLPALARADLPGRIEAPAGGFSEKSKRSPPVLRHPILTGTVPMCVCVAVCVCVSLILSWEDCLFGNRLGNRRNINTHFVWLPLTQHYMGVCLDGTRA